MGVLQGVKGCGGILEGCLCALLCSKAGRSEEMDDGVMEVFVIVASWVGIGVF